MRELHLFAGAGGGILGGMLLGHRCVGAVEVDKYARAVLEARQRDGYLEPFPIHDDIRTFDATPWKGAVDVVCGGFPCQDISSAGRGAGLVAGKKSNLWFEMLRVVRECEPAYVFIENSPMLRTRGLDVVLEGLAGLGFDAAWDVVSAADLGAPHIRKRMWILGWHPDRRDARSFGGFQASNTNPTGVCSAVSNPNGDAGREQQVEAWGQGAPDAGDDGEERNVADAAGERCQQQRWARSDETEVVAAKRSGRDLANTSSDGRRRRPEAEREHGEARERWDSKPVGGCGRDDAVADADGFVGWSGSAEEDGTEAGHGSWWQAEPPVGRVVDGMANRVGQLRCLGNGQVPIVAATAFRLLRARLENQP